LRGRTQRFDTEEPRQHHNQDHAGKRRGVLHPATARFVVRGVVTGSAGYDGFSQRSGIVNFCFRQDIWRGNRIIAVGVGSSVCRRFGRRRTVGLWRRE
jgi:hypothetical protein